MESTHTITHREALDLAESAARQRHFGWTVDTSWNYQIRVANNLLTTTERFEIENRHNHVYCGYLRVTPQGKVTWDYQESH